jgi:putative ABC transport system substrate-binding protein
MAHAAQGFRSARGFRLIFAAAALLAAAPLGALDKAACDVAVVVDVLKPKFQEILDGFKAILDAKLAAAGAKAVYRVYDTKTDPASVPAILDALRAKKPDLLFAINNPASFADRNLSLKLAAEGVRVVSENCIPLQSGVAKEWLRPGGNITGVGVFVQMTSLIRLAKMVNPGYKKLVFFGWDKMTDINAWFLAELTAACKQEGIELAEVKWLASIEEEMDFIAALERYGPEYFGVESVSAWVHRDGSYADVSSIASPFFVKDNKRFANYGYDESAMLFAYPAGTCVDWRDLGMQLGEKAYAVVAGAKPGDLPWEYPRKSNIILNVAAAKRLGLTIPPAVVAAAYRVYTDYDGNYVGRKN